MLKFMSVGFFNLALSFAIFHVTSEGLNAAVPDVHLRLTMSLAIAFCVTSTVAFLLNSRITFRDRHADFKAYCRYGAVNLVGLALQGTLLLGFTHLLALLRSETDEQLVQRFPIGKDIAYLAAVGLVFFWNFFMSRHWVFRTAPAASMTTVVQRSKL